MSEIDHKKRIEDLVKNNKVFVFMKGEADNPMCGFSAVVTRIFGELGVNFQAFNVLEDPEMRQAIKDYTEWPTIPQIFVNGEFIGGSDILAELNESGELKEMLGLA